MKNITLAVDDATYRRARRHAMERGTSVSGLVRELLQTLDAVPASAEEASKNLFAAMDKVKGYSAAGRLSRKQVHERALFR
ncbi:MAG: hypothetical protein QM661_01680 [Solimonas sp.]